VCAEPCRLPLAAAAVVDAVMKGNVDPLQGGTPPHTANGVGPREAIKRAKFTVMNHAERLEWVEQARLDAILGCCSLSMKSWKSGARSYYAFCGMLSVVLVCRYSLLVPWP
jgi:hypothetical protein